MEEQQPITPDVAKITAWAIQQHLPEQQDEPRETQFRVKGKVGRAALCLKLVEAYQGTDVPCCALVVGNPDAADLWNGGYYQEENGFRRALPKPHNIVPCPMVSVSYKGRESLVGRTFSKRRTAQEVASYIYESRQPIEYWEKLNKFIKPEDERYKKPLCNHPIGILVLITQDGMKEFLSSVESIPDLVIYHMDAADFDAEDGGIEPVSDVAIFEDEEQLSYPVDIYAGTLAGEFAERCTKGNHIAVELFIEAFLTVLGAVVGNQLRGDRKGMFARQYVIAVAPPQHGKDVAIDASQEVFRAEPEEFDTDGGQPAGFLTHKVDFKNIGAKPVNFASENGAIDAALECSRLLNVPPEFGSLLEKSGIAGAGAALLELMLAAWDTTFPKLSTAKGRKEVPSRLFLSILTSIQPDRLGGMQVSSGLYSRCIWIAVPPLDVVASLPEVAYGDFQKRLFAKLLPLEQSPITITTSPEAIDVLNTWFGAVKARKYEDDQIRTRINTIALRKALVLAWLRDEPTITAEVMGQVTRWCDWQLSVRANLFLSETDNDIARHQVRIRKALRKGPLTARKLCRAVHAYRVGTEIHERALRGLLFTKEVKTRVTNRVDSNEYYIPKEN